MDDAEVREARNIQRRDGYIWAAMIALGPRLLNMQLDEGEASKAVLVVADSMMAAADKEKT